MKKVLLILLAAMTLAGCVKHEEMSFSGKVVGIKQCEMTYADRNAGYIVQLETPSGVGATVVSNDKADTMHNVVVLYEPPRILTVSTHIHGSFYFDEKYSRTKGCVIWNDDNIGNLPEGVFTKVVVD